MGQITAKISKRQRLSSGSLLVFVDLTFSSLYAAGGDDLPTNANLGLGTGPNALHAIFFGGLGTAGLGYLIAVDLPNRKIRVFGLTAGPNESLAEVGGLDLSALTVRALVFGDGPGL